MPVVAGLAINRGAADVIVPAITVFASDGNRAVADVEVPAPEVFGLDSSENRSYSAASIVVPPPGVVAGDAAGYSLADVSIPAMSVHATGGLLAPQAQGADVAVPGVLLGAVGYTGTVGGADITLPAIDGYAADRPYAYADIDLPPATAFGFEALQFDAAWDGEIPGLDVQDFFIQEHPPNSWFGWLSGLNGYLATGSRWSSDLPALTGEIHGDLQAVIRFDLTFPAMVMYSTSTTWQTSEWQGLLDLPLDGDLYGGSNLSGTLPALGGEFSMTVGSVSRLVGDLAPLTGILSATAELRSVLDGSFAPLVAVWTLWDGELPALGGDFVVAPVTETEYSAWVMNVAHAGVTRWPGFPFAFIARWQGKHYLGNADGLHRYGGDDDDGEPIAGAFALPPMDFGSSVEKRCPRFYLQGKLGGDMTVGVSVDEGPWVSSRTDGRAGVDYWRAKLPRGLKGHTWQFAVSNVDGADFEIEQTDVLIQPVGRKI